MLELAGRPDIEVAIGRETPLARKLVTTPETHGHGGIGYAELPPARMPLSPRFGRQLKASYDLVCISGRPHAFQGAIGSDHSQARFV